MQLCCTTINETLRVYYRVTSLRKKRSEIYYSTKGLLRPKAGLVLPKFHSKHACSLLHHHKWNWRVYYRVTSLCKRRSEIYYSTKGLLLPKSGLVLPKLNSKINFRIFYDLWINFSPFNHYYNKILVSLSLIFLLMVALSSHWTNDVIHDNNIIS